MIKCIPNCSTCGDLAWQEAVLRKTLHQYLGQSRDLLPNLFFFFFFALYRYYLSAMPFVRFMKLNIFIPGSCQIKPQFSTDCLLKSSPGAARELLHSSRASLQQLMRKFFQFIFAQTELHVNWETIKNVHN